MSTLPSTHPVGSCGGALKATTGCNCLASDSPAGAENLIALAPEHVCPTDYDPEWFGRLQPHQQRDLVEDGVLTVLDADGGPIEVRPGVIDYDAEDVYTRGQCLALAVVLAEQNNWKVGCFFVDHGDVDEDGEPFSNLGHAYAVRPDGVLVDIHGGNGTVVDVESGRRINGDSSPDYEVFDDPREALDYFDGYLSEQDLVVAETFAPVARARSQMEDNPFYPGAPNYEALSSADARALLDARTRARGLDLEMDDEDRYPADHLARLEAISSSDR